MEDDELWETHIRQLFPDWGTDEALARWPAIKQTLALGQTVSGVVFSRAPFGVWLDIGVGYPALLLVPNMAESKIRRISFEDYPPIGSHLSGRINSLGDRDEIGVTQQHPDRLLEGTD